MKTKIYNIIKRDKIFLISLLLIFIYYFIKFVNQKYFGLEGNASLHYIVGLRNGWLRGEIYPLWFDNIYLGAPLWQHGFIVPFILPAVCFFLDPIVSSKLFNLIFFILSAYTMYLYVYSHIKNRFISALSGLIFIFVPQRLWENFTWGFYTPQLHYFLIPLLLLSMEKMFQEKKYYFYAVILLGLILSTYSNFLYIMVLFMVLVVLYHLYNELSDMQKRSLWFFSLFILFFMGKIRFSISVWLAMASIFYFYRFIKGDRRQFRFIKPIFVLLFGLGLTAIFWVPLIFLGPYKDFCGFNIIEQLTHQINVVDSWKYASLMVENSTRVNIFIPILAFSVVFTRGWKNSIVRFYSLILIIVMVLNIKFQPLWEFFNNNIPFFYNMRYPERFVNFFGIIFYPLMAAYSLEGFYSFFKSSLEKLKEQFLAYYSIRTFQVISFIFIGFIICYIFYINQKLNFSEQVAFSKPQPKIPMEFLKEKDKRIVRFVSTSNVWIIDNWTHDTMWSPFIYTNGMKSLVGDGSYMYRDFVVYFPHDGPGKIIIMGMMNTKYIMTKLKIPDSDINDLNLIVVPSESSDFYIYENKKCLPRVLLTKGSTVDIMSIQGWATDWVKQIPFDRVSFIGPLKEGNKELTGISFKHIKPLKILMNDNVPIFEVPPKRKQIERNKFIPETAMVKLPLESIKYTTIPQIKGTIDIINETANYIKLNANTLEDTILIYTKANWPGWEAKIDGKKQDLFNANGMMVGLFVPSGNHCIEIKYTYAYFYLFAAKITFITLLIFLLIWTKDVWYKWICRNK